MLRRRGRAWWGAALAPLALPTIAAACSAPSENVDAGDLLGVFAHDGGADASTDAVPSDAGALGAGRSRARRGDPPGVADVALVACWLAWACLEGEPDTEVSTP